MKKENGGAAFPCSGYGQWEPQAGMTLRDYFAAKAMQSAITSNDRDFDDMCDTDIAAYSYELADAMLVARVKS